MGNQGHGTTAALDDQQPVEVVTAVEVAPASAAGVEATAPAPHINHTSEFAVRLLSKPVG